MRKTLILTISLLLCFALGVQAETQRLGQERITFHPTAVTTKTAAYTITSSDSLINVTTSNANLTMTLPTIASVTTSGTKSYKILKTDANAYSVIVAPATGNTIGGESNRYIIGQNHYIVISAGPGTDWTIDYESPYVNEDHELGTISFGGLATSDITGDVTVIGTTPAITMGDADAEDTQINFDGNAVDFSFGLDDTADKLVISKDTTLGTTNIMAIANTPTSIVLHDASAADATVALDGNAQDFYICLDDSADDLVIGLGATCGSTAAFSIDENQVTTWVGGTIKLAAITTETDVLTVAECGKTIFLNSATEYQTTLPALSTAPAGCEFTFIVKAAASSANYTVITGNSKEAKIYGSLEVAGAVVACSAEDTVTLVDGNALGDWFKVVSDGTNWYIRGQATTSAKMTCTDEA